MNKQYTTAIRYHNSQSLTQNIIEISMQNIIEREFWSLRIHGSKRFVLIMLQLPIASSS